MASSYTPGDDCSGWSPPSLNAHVRARLSPCADACWNAVTTLPRRDGSDAISISQYALNPLK